MNYNIYVVELNQEADVQEYALEIQPPLASVALEGLVKRLTTRSARESNNSALAEDVAVVRQDEDGTAFVITPERDVSSAQYIGDTVARMLNPCYLPTTQITVQGGGLTEPSSNL